MKTHKCRDCNSEKPIKDFGFAINPSGKKCIHGVCKKCSSIRRAKSSCAPMDLERGFYFAQFKYKFSFEELRKNPEIVEAVVLAENIRRAKLKWKIMPQMEYEI
jgi:hypothetical protein